MQADTGRAAQRRLPLKRVAFVLAGLAVLAFGVIQLVPYGRAHANPPVRAEPAWDSPRTRELAVRACFACHSNETTWPWYSNIAPISWFVQSHVNEGRDELNYSEWDLAHGEADESAETVIEGEMPPGYFTLGPLHSSASLSDSEKAELVTGLLATFGGEGGGDGRRDRDRDERDDDD